MKSFSRLIYLLCLLCSFSLIYPHTALADVDLPWSTTYDCDEWNTYSDPLNCDGLSKYGGWTCSGGQYEQINSAANNPIGGGGKGQRHWEGDGQNNGSGGTKIEFNSRQPELWVRWYMRYQQGFAWSPLGYDKLLYLSPQTIIGWYGNNGIYLDPGGKWSGMGWQTVMGGNTSDGKWHCYEFHIKKSGGIFEFWIDGKKVINVSNLGLSESWTQMIIGSNQNCPNNGGCEYVDFDDIAISNTGYIGPIPGGSDTIPPSVSISSPTPGQTVSGSVTISASASDNVGVAGVQFKIDGNDVGAEDVTSPYSISLDTTAFSDGSHTLTATARDAAGNQATSSPVSITISNGGSDTIPPSVSISSPTPGQTVSGSVTISASASDNVGVAGVQFKIDGNDVGAEDVTSPYSISLDTTVFSDGSHTLTATARDAAGNQATSSPVSVTISNGGSDTTPPSVSISSPTPGQTVSGILTISASASDDVGVAGVQFKIDGNDVGAEDVTSPYSISQDTTVFSDGSHTLTATARDAAGNQATSSPVSITISNGGGGGGEILFEETFEDAAFDTRGWYDNINLQLSATEHIPGSTSSVEYHFLQGATTPTSGGAIRKKFTDTDTIYVSYYVKYSSNWEGSNRSYHPHEFLLLTNLDGDWVGPAYNYLTTYIEQNEGEPLVAIQDGKNIDESNIGVDLTEVTENRAVAGCNGDSDGYGEGSCYSGGSVHYNGKAWRAGSVYFQDTPGQYYKSDWHHIEVYIKLNSISDGKGLADGVIQYWYDGNLIIDHSDVVLRTGQYPDMKFNQFIIAPWIGDGSPVDQTFWVDNLTVATSRPSGLVPTIPTYFETK